MLGPRRHSYQLLQGSPWLLLLTWLPGVLGLLLPWLLAPAWLLRALLLPCQQWQWLLLLPLLLPLQLLLLPWLLQRAALQQGQAWP